MKGQKVTEVPEHMPECVVQSECSKDLLMEDWPIREGSLKKAGCVLGCHRNRKRAEVRGPRCLDTVNKGVFIVSHTICSRGFHTYERI